MFSLRSVLLAGTTLTILTAPAVVGSAVSAPLSQKSFLIAQTETDPAVAAAEQAVEDARAALRDAMATSGDERAARRALNEALKGLNEARVAAGLPPLGKNGAPPAAAEAPPETPPPAAAEVPASPAETPPSAAEAPPSETPPPTAGDAPPGQPPAAATDIAPDEKPAKKPDKKPIEAESPPAEGAPAEAQTPPVEPPPAEAATPSEPPAIDAAAPPVDEDMPKKAPKPGKKPPQLGQEEPAPPIPDAKLPKSSAEVKEGQEIESEGGRTITKEGGQLTIRHDDDSRFQEDGGRVKVEQTQDGGSVTTLRRPNGVQIVTVRDPYGNIVQRFRKLPNGEVEMLIGAAGPGGPGFQPGQKFPKPPKFPTGPGIPPYEGGGNFDFGEYLPPLEVPVPQDDYIVESQHASPDQIEEALMAPPIEEVERPYTLEEIRRSERLRAKLRRIDVDTVNFEFGSAAVGEDQVPRLQVIGDALLNIIQRDPSEVFLIEGHTDAVGSDLANLALSDRRAESVAEILTYYFQIPPENLITQGYGEQYLKIPTPAAEIENRRVTLRRIKPLMQTGQYQQ